MKIGLSVAVAHLFIAGVACQEGQVETYVRLSLVARGTKVDQHYLTLRWYRINAPQTPMLRTKLSGRVASVQERDLMITV